MTTNYVGKHQRLRQWLSAPLLGTLSTEQLVARRAGGTCPEGEDSDGMPLHVEPGWSSVNKSFSFAWQPLQTNLTYQSHWLNHVPLQEYDTSLAPPLWSQDFSSTLKPRAKLGMLFLPHSISGMQTVRLGTCMGYLLPLNPTGMTTASFVPVKETHYRYIVLTFMTAAAEPGGSWSLWTMKFVFLMLFYVGYLI